jgi:sugar lactone lactonase YvrE
MRSISHALSCLLVLSALAGCDGGSTTPDGGSTTDSGPRPDSGSTDAGRTDGGTELDSGTPTDAGPMGTDAGPADGGTPSTCGTAEPDVAMVTGTEGVVIARDGTIYFSQSGGVGRLTPDGMRNAAWASIPSARTVWGLALDAANEWLFVGVPGNGVFRIPLTGTPTPERIVSGGAANGLTMGPDGFLYYSDFSAGRVFRVSPDGGTPTEVTASTIASANGVAFEAAGTLLVASYSSGDLWRLTLAGGVETGRARVARGLGAPDGLAIDAMGRIYVTDNGSGNVLRIEADGSGMTTLLRGVRAAAALEFGSGALRCTDLYVASSGAMRRYANDAEGASVPWH